MKQILKFHQDQNDNTLIAYQSNADNLNQLLSHYRQIKGAPVQDKEEGEKIRLEPLKSVLKLIGEKSGFPNNPLEFQLSASGLGMDYQTFLNYLEGKEVIFKQDIFQYNQGFYQVSDKAIADLKEACTIYATAEQLPKLQYFQKLAESLNNGIEIGYISDYQRANICRSIQGLNLDVQDGNYVIGINTGVLFNS
jgi:hypothetical protein